MRGSAPLYGKKLSNCSHSKDFFLDFLRGVFAALSPPCGSMQNGFNSDSSFVES